jgi:hypothetical protein
MIPKHKMEGVMKKTFFVIFILLFFTSYIFAEDIYTYTDKDGTTIISNTPVPEKYEKRAKKIESTEQESPRETHSYQSQGRYQPQNGYQPQGGYQVQGGYQTQGQTSGAKKDATCKHECDVDRSTCMSDCSRHSGSYTSRHDTDNYERASCKHDCTTTYQSCESGCKD